LGKLQTYKSSEQIAGEALGDLEEAGPFQRLFIFYWRREIFRRFTASKAMSAGIFIRVIHCLFIQFNKMVNWKLFH